MRIKEAKVNKPQNDIAEALSSLSRQGMFDSALDDLVKIDNKIDMRPVADAVSRLKSDLKKINSAIEKQKLDPKINIKPPDLTKIDKALNNLVVDFQALLQGVDIMERKELAKNFKKIIELLEKIAAVEWVSQGTTIMGGGGGVLAPDESGTWGYSSGTNGIVTLTGNKRVLQITAVAQEAAATITINGGDTVNLPYGSTDKVSSAITIEPKGNLVDPVIVFSSGVDSYFVEYVS